MTSKIGLGVISFAHGHANLYCQRLATYDDVQLVGAWDDDAARGSAAADQYGMRYSPHLEDLLDDPAIQGVIVTCETNRHAEMVEAATGLNLWAEWAKVEYANATKTVYDDPIMKKDLAGILISLIKDPKPDYNMFSDKEIVWRMEDQDHHIGMIVSSHERQIVLDLLDKFSHVVKERFHAAAPAPDKPIH